MPAKNAAPYINETIESIINQTNKNWELIIVNDHSTDDTASIAAGYTLIDKRISLIQNSGTGIIDALNLASNSAKGTYVTRMDADDIMTADKLQSLLDLLLKVGEGYVATAHVKYFSKGRLGDGFKRYEKWLNALSLSENHYQDIYKECVIPSPCWMMHKNDLIRIGGVGGDRYPEDYDLCFRMYEHHIKVLAVQKILHLWRDYPKRTSRNDPNYADNRFFELKLYYFFKLTYNQTKDLILFGAGKKAKKIAQTIINKQIHFEWFSNNPNKIGHDIYGKIIKDLNRISLNESCQIIIAISNPEEQTRLNKQLKKAGLSRGHDYFFFC